MNAIEVKLEGWGGNPRSCVSWEVTATGLVVRIYDPLATALVQGLQKPDAK